MLWVHCAMGGVYKRVLVLAVNSPDRVGAWSLSCSGCAGAVLLALLVPGLNIVGWTPLPLLAGPVALIGLLLGLAVMLWSRAGGRGFWNTRQAVGGVVVGALSLALYFAFWNGWFISWLR